MESGKSFFFLLIGKKQERDLLRELRDNGNKDKPYSWADEEIL